MLPAFCSMFRTRWGRIPTARLPAYRQTWFFFFASDKWQATPKLTVDYGLRYELYPLGNAAQGGGLRQLQPGEQLACGRPASDGNPSNLGMQTDFSNFAPRLGASYRVTEQTVVRAGFGVSYVPFVDNTYAYNYPIKTSTFYTNSPTYGSALNPAGGVVKPDDWPSGDADGSVRRDREAGGKRRQRHAGACEPVHSAELQECLCELLECGRCSR